MNRKLLQLISFAFLIAAQLVFSHLPAKADLRICNKTTEMIGVAIGFRNKTDWQSSGWWRIPADQCESVIKNDLTARFYYLYGEHASQEGTWGGNIYMCNSSDDFEITGVKDCYARGFEKLGFFEVDTGDQENWTVQFKDKLKIEPNSASENTEEQKNNKSDK